MGTDIGRSQGDRRGEARWDMWPKDGVNPRRGGDLMEWILEGKNRNYERDDKVVHEGVIQAVLTWSI